MGSSPPSTFSGTLSACQCNLGSENLWCETYFHPIEYFFFFLKLRLFYLFYLILVYSLVKVRAIKMTKEISGD
jgi:hypothetical protein